jgi:hypothetical protein
VFTETGGVFKFGKPYITEVETLEYITLLLTPTLFFLVKYYILIVKLFSSDHVYVQTKMRKYKVHNLKKHKLKYTD